MLRQLTVVYGLLVCRGIVLNHVGLCLAMPRNVLLRYAALHGALQRRVPCCVTSLFILSFPSFSFVCIGLHCSLLHCIAQCIMPCFTDILYFRGVHCCVTSLFILSSPSFSFVCIGLHCSLLHCIAQSAMPCFTDILYFRGMPCCVTSLFIPSSPSFSFVCIGLH